MFLSSSRSEASTIVSYDMMDVGLYFQDGQPINYVSTDRAAELVAQMPSKDRKALLKPIETGLINPHSVFYLIDHRNKGQVAISVEDFVHLASTRFSDENNVALHNGYGNYSAEDNTPVPQRLIEALCRKIESENDSTSECSSIDYEKVYASDQVRSRGESTGSEASTSSTVPILPKSRPPPRPSLPVVRFSTTQKSSESNDADVVRIFYGSKERSVSSSALNTETNKEECWTKIDPKPKRRSLFPAIIAVVLTVAAALAVGIYFLVKKSNSQESLITTTAHSGLSRNETYNCVNGSAYQVLLDGAPHPLFELSIPERYPTKTAGSLEYLVVPNVTSWWDAQKYCTAWCGYLVSIKGSEENAMVLEMVKQHPQKLSDYWIGVKSWNNKWYLDDESNMTYYHFVDAAQQDASNIENSQLGCGLANGSGLWISTLCQSMKPFVCERNTTDPKIRQTPFAPHQERPCQEAGGVCKMDNDCVDGHQFSLNLCPYQAKNILCCIPKDPKPPPIFNSTLVTCEDAGGICNHVIYDECRDGLAVFDLSQSCPSTPRQYDCCVP